MSDDPAPDRDGNVGGIVGAIRELIEAVSAAEREDRSGFGGTGRYSRGHFTTEYGFAGRLGASGPGTAPDRESPSRSSDSAATERDDSYRVDVRHDADELLVVADLPSVDVGDLTLGVDERRQELVLGVEDRVVERLALPWPVASVDARFRHGVLELRFAPETEENDG